jgi:hypothetical protein
MADLRQAALRELARRELARREAAQTAPASEPAPEAAPPASGMVDMLSKVGDAQGKAEAFGRGAANGATLGFKGEALGLMQALADRFPTDRLTNPIAFAAHLASGRPVKEFFTDYLDDQAKVNDGRGQSLLDTYRQYRDEDSASDKASEQAHGGSYFLGNILGGAAPSVLAPAGKAATLGKMMLQGLKAGAIGGAAYGLGTSNADLTSGRGADWLQALEDTALGGAGGGAVGAAAPLAVTALGYGARSLGGPAMKLIRGGYVTPTAEAQRLMEQGANLTLGRMDPASTLGRFEELATSKTTGGSLKALRDQGDSSVRDTILKAAGAPGAAPPTRGTPVADQLSELRAGFAKVYDDALKDVRVSPEVAPAAKTAFEAAATAKDINATAAVRRQATKWLANEATSLVPDESGVIEAKSIQQLRTRLRDEIRGLGDEGDDRAMKKIVQRAEEFVSGLLEKHLPPEKAAMLRAADGSYRNLLTVEDAAKRAFVHNQEMTPTQVLQAIRSRGATPGLESVARDAHGVLTATYPLTGVQSAAGEVAPALKFVGPGFAHLSNTVPFLRQHALNPLWRPGLPARSVAAAGRALEAIGQSPRATSAAGRSLYDLLTSPPPQVSLAQAEDEDRPAWAAAR